MTQNPPFQKVAPTFPKNRLGLGNDTRFFFQILIRKMDQFFQKSTFIFTERLGIKLKNEVPPKNLKFGKSCSLGEKTLCVRYEFGEEFSAFSPKIAPK